MSYIKGINILVMELVGPKYRLTAANTIYYFYIVGEFITVLLAYFIRDFRMLHIALAVILSTFSFYFWYSIFC